MAKRTCKSVRTGARPWTSSDVIPRQIDDIASDPRYELRVYELRGGLKKYGDYSVWAFYDNVPVSFRDIKVIDDGYDMPMTWTEPDFRKNGITNLTYERALEKMIELWNEKSDKPKFRVDAETVGLSTDTLKKRGFQRLGGAGFGRDWMVKDIYVR